METDSCIACQLPAVISMDTNNFERDRKREREREGVGEGEREGEGEVAIAGYQNNHAGRSTWLAT